ncbi:GntR family transcriptional regulator [Arthrobacter sp. NPDC089319]|uniref:GntR family transcriptional regulator n=1 Tax=Arthrobacter sp. NPDC089319 TaxID=3155915 RepID=UPI00343A6607
MTATSDLHPSRLETVSAVDAAGAYLRREILRGAFEPGERIRESPLAASLGISRHTLRAAFARLESVGLVTYRENRGWSVPVFDRAEYEDILLLRQSLESTAYRIILERAIVPDARVEAALRRVQGVTEEVEWSERLEVDGDLHQTLVDLAGSRRLSQSFADMLIELRLCRLQSVEWLEQRGLEHWKQLHVDLVEALRRGDRAVLQDAGSHFASHPWADDAETAEQVSTDA